MSALQELFEHTTNAIFGIDGKEPFFSGIKAVKVFWDCLNDR